MAGPLASMAATPPARALVEGEGPRAGMVYCSRDIVSLFLRRGGGLGVMCGVGGEDEVRGDTELFGLEA